MAAEAGWYDDPTKRGRLRYWDGGAWTEHVSAGRGTTLDPITAAPPEPPAESAAATPREPEPTVTSSPVPTITTATAPAEVGLLASRGPYPATLLGRAGLALGGVAGVLLAASAGRTVVEQLGGDYTLGVRNDVIVYGVIAAVLCLLTAVAPWAWARLTGVGITTLAAITTGLVVAGFRTDEDLLEDVDISVASGGALIVAGALVFWLATAVALIGLRRPPSGPDPALAASPPPEPAPPVPTSGKAVASMVTGIVGVVRPVTAAIAIGLALFAFDDHRAAGGRLGGKGMAVAGLVLGIVVLSLWCLGLTLAMFLATP